MALEARTNVRVGNVVMDCADPRRLAEFWSAALGWEVRDEDPQDPVNDWFEIQDPAGSRPQLAFQRVPEPKTVKNRVHLDLLAADEEAVAARLADLGATRLRKFDHPDDTFVVMADPEGNEFCVVKD